MSTLNDFGIPGVGNGINQPKLSDRWRITFANLAGGVSSVPVSMNAISVALPTFTQEEIQLDRYNSRAWIGGKTTWNDITLTVADDVTNAVSNVIQAQTQKQKFLTGVEGAWLAQAGEASLYKFATYIDTLDGADQPTDRWVLEGCWIKSANLGTLNYKEATERTIEIVLRYDNAVHDLNSFKYSKGPGSSLGGHGI